MVTIERYTLDEGDMRNVNGSRIIWVLTEADREGMID